MPKIFGEFKEFLSRTNALALAVGVVLGTAVGKVVSSIVGDLVMPIVALATPSGEWREITAGRKGEFKVGSFLGAAVDFVVVSFVVFLLVKALLREKPAPSTTKACPECLEQVPLAARRCRACTSPL